jgi:peroxiredoxin
MTTDVTGIRLEAGQRLPDLDLPSAPSGAPVPLRRRARQGTVLIVLHGADCDGCRSYLEAIAAAYEQLRDWDGRVVPVVEGPLAAAAQAGSGLDLPFPVLADPAGRLREGWAIGGGSLLIADQWGELFLVQSGSPGSHDLPSPEEVAEWLRFVAIQCPECQGEAL